MLLNAINAMPFKLQDGMLQKSMRSRESWIHTTENKSWHSDFQIKNQKYFLMILIDEQMMP